MVLVVVFVFGEVAKTGPEPVFRLRPGGNRHFLPDNFARAGL